jgi:peptide/nickel transport system ATP-binding protein
MPYAWGLLSSMPRLDRLRQDRLQPIPGQPPSLIQVPKGCVFNPRCTYKEHVEGNRCKTEHPDLVPTAGGSEGHAVRCHIHPDERRRLWAETIQPTL